MRSETGPCFYAHCDPADRLEALVATLSTIARPGQKCEVWISPVKGADSHLHDISVEEAIAAARAANGTGIHITTSFFGTLSSGRTRECAFSFLDALHESACHPSTELFSGRVASVGDLRDEPLLLVPVGSGEPSIAVEAAITVRSVEEEMDQVLRALCVPDAQTRVRTSGASMFMRWGAPVEACASYYADGNAVRDLALTWAHVHDGVRMRIAAAWSLDDLRARVEAAPAGTSVGVALSSRHIEDHLLADQRAEHSAPKRRDVFRERPRVRLAGERDLTREQVLAALSLPPATLLEALEATAVPDDEWRTAEQAALEAVESMKQGAPTYEVNVHTGRHTRWIELHAPYHVRRLPNGGVLLATHPYRTLWPLWADALSLLGVRE